MNLFTHCSFPISGKNLIAVLMAGMVNTGISEEVSGEAARAETEVVEAKKESMADLRVRELSERSDVLNQENEMMKRELRALRMEVAKLRAKSRQAEVMKDAEVSGQRALVEQLRDELAEARNRQAKSRQDLQEAHAEAALRIQRLRAMEEEVAKLTLERFEAEDRLRQQARPVVRKPAVRKPQVNVPAVPAAAGPKKDERYDDLLQRLDEVTRQLGKTLEEHRKAHR
ncbi:MAG: hypothetical protein ACSHYF_05080 [Verrucomicrobiaceae bacterium]